MITLPWRESFRYVACVSLSEHEAQRVIDALPKSDVRKWLENDNEGALYALRYQQNGKGEEP